MRLGELKNILDVVLNDDNKITLDYEQIYGGQAFRINNYSAVIKALIELKKQEWNDTPSGQFDKLVETYGTSASSVILNNQEYNELMQYINSINSKMPVFYGIIDSMVKKQNEHMINVRLPDKSDISLQDLSDINNRLDKIFKEINIDGTYEFKGFDVGSSWYEILILGACTYKFLIAALKIAQEFFKAKEEYYKSGEAKIHYEAAKAEATKKATDKEIREYASRVVDKKIELVIEQTVAELPDIGNKNENGTKLRKTVISISDELNNGLEFHLSLNPPKYAEEDGGKISINYETIRQIEADKNAPKQIMNNLEEPGEE